MDRGKFKQRIIEIIKCFKEQFIERGNYSYEECLDYCDFLFSNYKKMGILDDDKTLKQKERKR